MSEQPPSPLLVAIARWYRRTTIVIAVLTGWPSGEFRTRFLATLQLNKVMLLRLLLIAPALVILRIGTGADSSVILLLVLVAMAIATYIIWWACHD